MKQGRRSHARCGILVGIARAVPMLAVPADAAAERITHGETQAHYNTFINGGWAVLIGPGTPAVENGTPTSGR